MDSRRTVVNTFASPKMALPNEQIDELESSRGSIDFWTPHRNLLIVRVKGHFHAELLPAYMQYHDRFMQNAEQPILFGDWSGMKRYDRNVRSSLTNWVLKNRKKVLLMNLLVGSPFIHMGVTMANALLGNFMWVTGSDQEFFARLRNGLSQTPNNTVVGEALSSYIDNDRRAFVVRTAHYD